VSTAVVLPPNDEAPARARRLVAMACRGCSDRIIDTALVLTSELVTNAARHGAGVIQLDIEVMDGTLQVQVSDASSRRPRIRHPRGDEAGGRGLLIVQTMASDWGTRPRADTPGKTVWFTLQLA
jgi:anti-sigma regulatory factor (Ser/Thr protein kinase)